MRASWQKLCLLLLALSILCAAAMAEKKSKKHKKTTQLPQSKDTSPEDDHSKDKSTKSEPATTAATADIHPKMKPIHVRPHRNRTNVKQGNPVIDVPVITEEILDLQVQQVKVQDSPTKVIAKGHHSTDNCSSQLDEPAVLKEIEKDVTSLWSRVGALSQPVHIHVHGGQVSSPVNHRHQGCKGRCHGNTSHKRHYKSDDRNKQRSDEGQQPPSGRDPSVRNGNSNTTQHHGNGKNTSSLGGHHHHSHKSHHHHSHKSHHHHSHKGHHHHSHKSHHHSHKSHHHHSHKSHHHHSHKSHRDHEQHNVSQVGPNTSKRHPHSLSVHSSPGHDHDLHNSSKEGHKHGREHGCGGRGHSLSRGHGHERGHNSNEGQGHSLQRGHGHRRGHNDEEGRGHSTHVHIHVTIDEKPGHHDQSHKQPHSKGETPTDDEVFHARCDIRNHNQEYHLQGYVLLRQQNESLHVKVNISGFPPQPLDFVEPTDTLPHPVAPALHGFHVHEFGDFSRGCLSFGGHYNPESTYHGGLEHSHRHVGDWGNVEVDDQGVALALLTVTDATLNGHHSIVGRGIVVHGQADDLGEGHSEASKASGNAGGRLACCVIARSQPAPDEQFWPSP